MKDNKPTQTLKLFTCQQCHAHYSSDPQAHLEPQSAVAIACPWTACPWKNIASIAA